VAGLVPAIHVFIGGIQDVDAKQLGFAELRSSLRPKPETSGLGDNPGHDERKERI
jgi:hypothetical protein